MLIWIAIVLYLMFIILLSIPAVKQFIGTKTSEALSQKLGTTVSLESVDIGIPNRITINNISALDQNRKEMLSAPRISAKMKLRDLLNGKITISSAQVFGLHANLYRKDAHSPLNCQFVLDSLASKDTTKHTPLNLEISSLIIRRSAVRYDQLDEKPTYKFSTKHINVSNISAHIILNRLTDDSLDINLKRISLKEHSGLNLKRLSVKLQAGRNTAKMSDLQVALTNTRIKLAELTATYETDNKKKLKKGTLAFNSSIDKIYITPSDIACFAPILNNYNKQVAFSANVRGTDRMLDLSDIEITQANDLHLLADGFISANDQDTDWHVTIRQLTTSSQGIMSIAEHLGKQQNLPKAVEKLGNVSLTANAKKVGKKIDLTTLLGTDAGKLEAKFDKLDKEFTAHITAEQLQLQQLTNNRDFGNLSATITAKGTIEKAKVLTAKAHADINTLLYKSHLYRNIYADGAYSTQTGINANIDIDDNYCHANILAAYNLSKTQKGGSIKANIQDFNPHALGLISKWEGITFSFAADGAFTGNNINNAKGHLNVNDFNMSDSTTTFRMNSLELTKDVDNGRQDIRLKSDFATLYAEGKFELQNITNSITNAIYHRLPTLPGIYHTANTSNNINVYATVSKTDWAEKLLGIDLQLNEPAHLVANIDDNSHTMDIKFDAADFQYDGGNYKDGYLLLSCPNDTMRLVANAMTFGKNSSANYNLKAQAADNHLNTNILFKTNGKNSVTGTLNADARFRNNEQGLPTADINIQPSQVLVNDTVWNVSTAHILYYAKHLEIDNFSINHDNQSITVNGRATDSNDSDKLSVLLNDIDVSYILDIVNFHSVEFAGRATGKAQAHDIFGKPEAEAHLLVKDFTFEGGCLGTLDAHADWNLDEGAINIDALTTDNQRKTKVDGYVSPKHNDIDLKIKADGTNLKFLETYCDTFMDSINAFGWGDVRVVGPLKAIQLVGQARVEGSAKVSALNTTYTLRGVSVKLQPNDIVFTNDSIYDRDGHLGVVNGHLWHQNLSNLSYNIEVNARNMLGYDTHDFGENTFYGTAYVTGKCTIKGKSGEVVIDVDATPEKGSRLVYNTTSPDAISNHEFITWNDRNTKHHDNDRNRNGGNETTASQHDISSNLYLNFLVHCTPDAKVQLLMDPVSGDYIDLNGNGVLRAQYYDKGSFQVYGKYNVDGGVYKLTIQNAIKRDFEFLPGGSISFGGDAYNAILNLQAQYTVNGVSLSDINIGKSFSNNNIRVNCLMNITGTPNQPRVDFSLDMPTISSDAKQMVMRLMDSEEEMRQQVVYLLAVGRFFNQSTNNAQADETLWQNQTSLAMQSIISGTISQELTSVLSNVTGSKNWNFGANISTGDEGLYNAEYEGIVSGRLLNNRLLVNGQFGYRDNPNATSSFIGDFDIRYLLLPSGDLAVKIYNQTNEKYFTKNSLTTQGIGIILKRDFNGWKDLFSFLRRRKKEKTTP